MTVSRSDRKPEGQSGANVASSANAETKDSITTPFAGEPRNAVKQSTRGNEVTVSRSNGKPEGQSETNVATKPM